ncbi:helix-turn-helix transcriptional regulator [Paraneptunicella aestuarii]|uniref:helix-turn-helix transcriptional regulator n=1 Tax=Paraneptunicella aestuarii TaxID=2831148 RepID=UPI001E286E70|nr:helix-turn-helix transcriptional regulator [Paraneptunicella aestuarii]UAA38194.1 helix-turn-helix transcriptional regulator [Paraneptunicella aestuarii]
MSYVSGSDLRKIRMLAGKTTKQMAELAGVKTRKTYENWEKDIGTPSFNQFVSLIDSCGFKPADIVKIFIDRKECNTQLDVGSALLKLSELDRF